MGGGVTPHLSRVGGGKVVEVGWMPNPEPPTPTTFFRCGGWWWWGAPELRIPDWGDLCARLARGRARSSESLATNTQPNFSEMRRSELGRG